MLKGTSLVRISNLPSRKKSKKSGRAQKKRRGKIERESGVQKLSPLMATRGHRNKKFAALAGLKGGFRTKKGEQGGEGRKGGTKEKEKGDW